MTKNVVEVMLAIQISRAHFLFDNLRDELVSEPVLFHLIRRLGLPGTEKSLMNMIKGVEAEYKTSKQKLTIGFLETYCMHLLMELESSPPPYFALLDTTWQENNGQRIAHPISIIKSHGTCIEGSTICLATEELCSLLIIYYPTIAPEVITDIVHAWSTKGSVVQLKTVELFYYTHGFALSIESPLGTIQLNELKPADSTSLLYKLCEDELLRRLNKTYAAVTCSFIDDLTFSLTNDEQNAVVIHEEVLLIHLFSAGQRIQIESETVEHLKSSKDLRVALSKSLSAAKFIPETIDRIELPVARTIHLPAPPRFFYELDKADQWNNDILVKFLVEMLELPQYKPQFSAHNLLGLDFLYRKASMTAVLDEIPVRLHRLKVMENSDQLLLKVVARHYQSSGYSREYALWTSHQIAGMLHVEHQCIHCALYVARADLDGVKLSRMSWDDCQLAMKAVDASEAIVVMDALVPFVGTYDEDEELLPGYEETVESLSLFFSEDGSGDWSPTSRELPVFSAESAFVSTVEAAVTREGSFQGSVIVMKSSPPSQVAAEPVVPTEKHMHIDEPPSPPLVPPSLEPLNPFEPSVILIPTPVVSVPTTTPEPAPPVEVNAPTLPVGPCAPLNPADSNVDPAMVDTIDLSPATDKENIAPPGQLSTTDDSLNKGVDRKAPEVPVIDSDPALVDAPVRTETKDTGAPVLANINQAEVAALVDVRVNRAEPAEEIAPVVPVVLAEVPSTKPMTQAVLETAPPVIPPAGRSPWQEVIKRCQRPTPLNAMIITEDALVPFLCVQSLLLGFRLLEEFEKCPSSEMEILLVMTGIVKSAMKTTNKSSMWSADVALAISFIFGFIIKVTTEAAVLAHDGQEVSKMFLSRIQDGELPIRDLPIDLFAAAIRLYCGYSLDPSLMPHVLAFVGEGSSVLLSSMKGTLQGSYPFRDLDFSGDDSIVALLTLATVAIDNILSKHDSLHSSVDTLFVASNTSRIPTFSDILRGHDKAIEMSHSSAEHLQNTIKALVYRFFARFKSISTSTLQTIKDPLNKSWLKAMHQLKSNLDSSCAVFASSYLSTDSGRFSASERFERLLVLFTVFRVKAYQLEKFDALQQKLVLRIHECISTVPALKSTYSHFSDMSFERITTLLQLELGIPMVTSDFHISTIQVKIEQFLGQRPSLPTRMRSECNVPDEVIDMVAAGNDIVYKRRVTLLEAYLRFLHDNIGKVKEILLRLVDLWNATLEIAEEQGPRDYVSRMKAALRRQLDPLTLAVKELLIRDVMEDKVESLYLAFSNGAIDDPSQQFVSLFHKISKLENVYIHAKKDASLLMQNIENKLSQVR